MIVSSILVGLSVFSSFFLNELPGFKSSPRMLHYFRMFGFLFMAEALCGWLRRGRSARTP